VGLDLGQASDYTALSILQQEWMVKSNRYEYELQFLERVRGMPYPLIVEKVQAILRAPELQASEPPQLVIDKTGVGAPVCDMFNPKLMQMNDQFQAEYYEGLGLEATAIVNGAMDNYDAAEAIYNAYDPTQLYADQATYTQNASDCMGQVDYYFGLGNEATQIAEDALDEYNTAESIYNAYDPTSLYADAATYLENANDCLDQAEYYDGLSLEAMAIVSEAMDNYDAAEVIYDACDTTQLLADAATFFQNVQSCTAQADAYHEDYLDALQAAQNAMEEYIKAEFYFDAALDSLGIKEQSDTYSKCLEYPITEEVVSNYNAIWIGD
jgi:hypothetical protein